MLDPLTFPNKQENPTNSLTYTHIFLAKRKYFAQQCILTDSAWGKKLFILQEVHKIISGQPLLGILAGYSEGPSYKDTT